ncbi:MAG TPA: hypothetical protein DCR44_03455 [Acholeplasmatales bacterium]|nr:MAG: hypothetical protein A2Y16_01090 [Tenericutes bacterium GWF2_57_13]HAQ56446.1 hypothetical protein [Acholeplasmatales bacterium]
MALWRFGKKAKNDVDRWIAKAVEKPTSAFESLIACQRVPGSRDFLERIDFGGAPIQRSYELISRSPDGKIIQEHRAQFKDGSTLEVDFSEDGVAYRIVFMPQNHMVRRQFDYMRKDGLEGEAILGEIADKISDVYRLASDAVEVIDD